ncbi:hypothetical protein [Clostridium felsineum]|uniref:hypothetical protein n=1 Tax=Clostridium felsineum TaxID=36839 RepID=UPI00098C8B74|nr:hypothetical protein [Clostridium felsineum]URZ03979.1 hypothetical protein CLAUR_040450 [Clostridium felsineum]
MRDIQPNIKEVNLTIEVLSGICVGGGETETYSCDDYINRENKIYFLNLADIQELFQKGKLTEELLNELYEDKILDKKIEREILKELKSVEVKEDYQNKLEIHRFANKKKLTETGIEEIKTIMGSTIKGLIRHGFEIYNVKSVKYAFKRNDKNKLLLFGIDSINNITTKKEKYSLNRFPKGRYALKNYKCKEEFKSIVYKKFSDIIFKNVIFSDCEVVKGDFVIEKVESFSRTKGNFIIPSYYEIAYEGSIFKCKIVDKNVFNGKKEGNLSVNQVYYDNKNFIELSIKSLKRFYSKVIELEEEYYQIPDRDDKVKSFYSKLRQENSKPNQVVCKLGYSGAISKTLMCYEEENKDMLLPYNLRFMCSNRLPLGWVKINLGENQ